MERRKNTSANRRTCVLASGATAVVVMAGGSSAGASWTSAGTSITVSGQLTQIIVDGPPQADGHAARTETTAHVTIGDVTVDIDPRLARGARAGRVEVTVAGGDVTGRSARDLGEQLRAGEARITTVRGSEIGSTPSVLGQHHSVVVPVSWAGSPQPPTNGAAGAGFVDTYWAGNTENKVRNTIDKVYPTTKITPSAETIATCDHRALFDEVRAAIPAQPKGVLNHVIAVLPRTVTCSWSAVASLGAEDADSGAIFLVNGEQARDVYAHEFGHNLFLTHGGSLTCWNDAARTRTVPVSEYCETQTYDDPWDIMGNRREGALAAGNRWRLGVIPASARHTVTGGETLTLAPVAAAGGIRSVVFDHGGKRYEMEYRTATGWDDWIDDDFVILPGGIEMTAPGGGVIVRQVQFLETSLAEYDVVNFHPVGAVTYSNRHPGLEPGESYSFPGGLTITVESASSSGAKVTFRTAFADEVSRWYGADRYETSATISRNGFYDPTGQVFLASGSVFTDALSGAGVAAWAKGPLFLVKRDTLTRPVGEELWRLNIFDTTIFGGPASIGEDIGSVLSANGDVRRLAGADRYETSAKISRESFDPGVSVAYVASGLVFPDALSGAPVAGKNKAPVLLTKADGLPAAISTELKRLRPKSVVVLGGPRSVSETVLAQIMSATGVTPSRVSGADRYAVSALISRQNFTSGSDLVFSPPVRSSPTRCPVPRSPGRARRRCSWSRATPSPTPSRAS